MTVVLAFARRAPLLLASVFSAIPAHASNIAFWQPLTLSGGGPAAGIYWLSLPYSYTPADANSNFALDAEDLVQDFQPAGLPHPCSAQAASCAVVRVWQWSPSIGEYSSWTGGAASGTPFTLVPGTAYGIEIQTVTGHTSHEVDLVGAHDPALEHDECYANGAVNMRWISLPPNLDIDTSYGTPDLLDAEDLGYAMGGPEHVFQIRRLNESTGLFDSWVVGSVYGTPFAVDLTRAYAVDLSCSDPSANCRACPWAWTPATY